MVTKVRDKKKLQFLTKYEESANISTCCECISISRRTFYDWMESDKNFQETFNDIRESIKDFVEDQILMQIKAGEATMTIFFAKTQMKDRGYGDREQEILDHGKIQPPNVTFTREDMSNGKNGFESETV